MDIIQNLSSMTGWPSLVFMIVFMVTGGIYVSRTSKSKAESIAREANREAIAALQAHVHALQERIRYLEELLESAGIKH